MSKLSIRFYKQKLKTNTYSNKGTKRQRTFKSFTAQFKHDLRFEKMEKGYLKRPEEKNKNYFFNGIMKNSDSTDNLEKVPKLFEKIKSDYKKKYNRKLHKDTKPTLNFLLSFEKDFDLSEENREAQFQSVQRFINKNFAFPIYLTQHNDEKSLHYSFSVMNFDKDLKPIAKKIDTSYLQDVIADHLQQENQAYGHERGEKKAVSNKKHKTIMEGKAEEQREIAETLKKENQKLKEKNQELEAEIKNYEALFQMIYDDLMSLNEETQADKFLKLFNRYLRGEAKDKIQKLLEKKQRAVIKIKKQRAKEIGSENFSFTEKQADETDRGKTSLKGAKNGK